MVRLSKLSGKALVGFMVASLVFAKSSWGATVSDAVDWGRSAANLSWSGVSENAAAHSAIRNAQGDTAGIEALREDGQAKLYAPGRSEADRCSSATDPVCLAVQEVDRGGRETPSVNPDVTGELMKGYDNVTANAAKDVDLSDTGAVAGECRPATATVTPASETKTCDIRSVATTEVKSCLEATESFYLAASRWQCRIDAARQETQTCALPVGLAETHTYTVSCREGTRQAMTVSCPATVISAQAQVWTGRCTRPGWKAVTKTCTRRLLVKPEATCKVGDTVSARVSDYGVLAEDGVAGADALELSYVCTAASFPTLRIATNSATRGACDLVTLTAESVFSLVADLADGRVTYSGTLSCSAEKVCTASVTMTVYQGKSGEATKSGTLSKTLTFTAYAKTAESEYWDETCTEAP